ncbi:MAG: hypothetical protein LBG58_09735 [Planctomycetaceae bacterium]|jgi:hypothetical protein|nr:hypothetical protein [Planctomycetaceae bacterium]
MVFAVTRRDAAGWLVLPFQGERMTVTHKRKTLPQVGNLSVAALKSARTTARGLVKSFEIFKIKQPFDWLFFNILTTI